MYGFVVDAAYLAQLRQAGEFETEFRRRLIAEGVEMGEGAMHDCVTTHSREESDRIDEIWIEVCRKFGLC